MTTNNKAFELEERTAKFSEGIITLCKNLPQSTVTRPLISQLIRSATSIGANYCEANGASSKRDFKNKIHICKKEAIETKYWLRLLAKAHPPHQDKCRIYWQEVQEFTLIFSKIIGTINQSSKKITNTKINMN